jgi:hypothetical protein
MRLAYDETGEHSPCGGVGPIVADVQAGGATSLRQIAAALNERHIRTARERSGQPLR